MATGAQLQTQQLQQELQNELTICNQLLQLMRIELQHLKQATSPGGEFEAVIKQNASLMTSLASMQQVDIEKLPPISRYIDEINDLTQDHLHEQDGSLSPNMEVNQ